MTTIPRVQLDILVHFTVSLLTEKHGCCVLKVNKLYSLHHHCSPAISGFACLYPLAVGCLLPDIVFLVCRLISCIHFDEASNQS